MNWKEQFDEKMLLARKHLSRERALVIVDQMLRKGLMTGNLIEPFEKKIKKMEELEDRRNKNSALSSNKYKEDISELKKFLKLLKG